METNKMARDLLDTLAWREKTLAPALAEIAQAGFIADEDCYFLAWGAWASNKGRYLANQTVVQKRHPRAIFDATGLECWVNGHAIEGYVKRDVSSQAMLFAQRLLTDWARQYADKALVIIIGFQSPTTDLPYLHAQVTCHLDRRDQRYLGPDLEKVIQPVIRLNSMMDVL